MPNRLVLSRTKMVLPVTNPPAHTATGVGGRTTNKLVNSSQKFLTFAINVVTSPKFVRARNVSYHRVNLLIRWNGIHLTVFVWIWSVHCARPAIQAISSRGQYWRKPTHNGSGYWSSSLHYQQQLWIVYLTFWSSHFNLPQIHSKPTQERLFLCWGSCPSRWNIMVRMHLASTGSAKRGSQPHWSELAGPNSVGLEKYIFNQGWTVTWKLVNTAQWCVLRRTWNCQRC